MNKKKLQIVFFGNIYSKITKNINAKMKKSMA